MPLRMPNFELIGKMIEFFDSLGAHNHGKYRTTPRTYHGYSFDSPDPGSFWTDTPRAPTIPRRFTSQYAGRVTPARSSGTHRAKEAGIRAGEIVAWRAWVVEDNNLVSTIMRGAWDKEMEAHDDPSKEPYDPTEPYRVGIHAWKSYEVAHAYVLYSAHHEMEQIMAVGSVYLWGSVVVHEKGYRAQFARVRSIDCLMYPPRMKAVDTGIRLRELRQAYDVEYCPESDHK